MGQVPHLRHERSDCRLIDARIFIGPIVLVAESPENDGWVVVMLVDHVREHVFRILLKGMIADAGAAPWRLFPNHESKLIAQVDHQPVLLVVAEADEVCAHVADQTHLFSYQFVAHCSSDSDMVGVALGAAEKNPFPVEIEGTVLDKLNVANAKALVEERLPGRTRKPNRAAVEMRRLRRPQLGLGDAETSNLAQIVPGGKALSRPMDGGAARIRNRDKSRRGKGLGRRVIEPRLYRYGGGSVRGGCRQDLNCVEREGG